MTYKERMKRNRERHLKNKIKELKHWEDKEKLVAKFNEREVLLSRQQQIKEVDRKAKQDIEDWIKSNNISFSTKEFSNLWDNISKKYHRRMIKLMITYLALGEAANNANKTFEHSFKLENSGLDIDELSGYLLKLSRIDIVNLLTQAMDIAPQHKQDIKRRVIAKEFPTKDNLTPITKPTQTNTAPTQDVNKAIHDGIRQEVDRINRSNK